MSGTYIHHINDPFVYDKAKYHYEADNFPAGLPLEQAFVHTGFFVGWLAEQDLLDTTDTVNKALVEEFKRREITGPQLYERLGECLIDYMLKEEGNLFAREYFDFNHGAFIGDYRELLVRDLASDYHVQDTWQNYEIIKQRFNQRFQEWKARKEGLFA